MGLASLAAAAGVAYWLANRFARPLETAAAATGRIAGGDLATRIPVAAGDMPEFGALATSINAMGDSLARARDQQRQFLLSVSHDLRTPLTSIRGYADAMADGTTDDVTGAVPNHRSGGPPARAPGPGPVGPGPTGRAGASPSNPGTSTSTTWWAGRLTASGPRRRPPR